jgi:hypothetical protein
MDFQNEQSKNLKFLGRQRNYLAAHSNKMLLQAEIQVTFPDLRQRLICLRRNMIPTSKERCICDISRNIASLIDTNKLSQLFLLTGGKQSKEFSPICLIESSKFSTANFS